jgi:hypothetical protein
MPSLIGSKPNQVPVNADLGTLAFQDAENISAQGRMALSVNGTEIARLDSASNLLVGAATFGVNDGVLRVWGVQGVKANSLFQYNDTGPHNFSSFANGSNTIVGGIATDGATTAYNTTSDSRLKHDIQPMTGALAKVALLKPCTYKWNQGNRAGQGFIAHELQEVVPECVTGQKDAVDAEGNPVYQGIDTSFLVATLAAAIQEQQAIIGQLQARVEALENA